jgi:hypothetical protein
VIFRVHHAQPMRQADPIAGLRRRAERHGQEMAIVPRRPTGRAFDDVRRDRDGCPPDLGLQPEALLGRKTSGRVLDRLDSIVCHGEDLELCWISTRALHDSLKPEA